MFTCDGETFARIARRGLSLTYMMQTVFPTFDIVTKKLVGGGITTGWAQIYEKNGNVIPISLTAEINMDQRGNHKYL